MNRNEIKEKLIELCLQFFQNYEVEASVLEHVNFIEDLERSLKFLKRIHYLE